LNIEEFKVLVRSLKESSAAPEAYIEALLAAEEWVIAAGPRELAEAVGTVGNEPAELQEVLAFVLGRRKESRCLTGLIALAQHPISTRVRAAIIHAVAASPYISTESRAERTQTWYARNAQRIVGDEAAQTGFGTHPGFTDIAAIDDPQVIEFITGILSESQPQTILLHAVLALEMTLKSPQVYSAVLGVLTRDDVGEDVRLHAVRALGASERFPQDLLGLLSDSTLKSTFKAQILDAVHPELLPRGYLEAMQPDLFQTNPSLGLKVLGLRARDSRDRLDDVRAQFGSYSEASQRWNILDTLARYRPGECQWALSQGLVDSSELIRRRALIFLVEYPAIANQTSNLIETVRSLRIIDASEDNRDLARRVELAFDARGPQE
ncbi:MAG: hypothetical protein ACRD2L_05400, partial [Terriglobia bacterium]